VARTPVGLDWETLARVKMESTVRLVGDMVGLELPAVSRGLLRFTRAAVVMVLVGILTETEEE
jgi:hypothetical protein